MIGPLLAVLQYVFYFRFVGYVIFANNRSGARLVAMRPFASIS